MCRDLRPCFPRRFFAQRSTLYSSMSFVSRRRPRPHSPSYLLYGVITSSTLIQNLSTALVFSNSTSLPIYLLDFSNSTALPIHFATGFLKLYNSTALPIHFAGFLKLYNSTALPLYQFTLLDFSNSTTLPVYVGHKNLRSSSNLLDKIDCCVNLQPQK